jgi:hypothetical protein
MSLIGWSDARFPNFSEDGSRAGLARRPALHPSWPAYACTSDFCASIARIRTSLTTLRTISIGASTTPKLMDSKSLMTVVIARSTNPETQSGMKKPFSMLKALKINSITLLAGAKLFRKRHRVLT